MNALAAAPQLRRRIEVVLVGISVCGTGTDGGAGPYSGTPAERVGRATRRTLKVAVVAEACRVLTAAGAGHETWSHAFRISGRHYLLATRFQPGRTMVPPAQSRARSRKHRLTKILPARLIIEVSPSPAELEPRTLLRPRQLSIELQPGPQTSPLGSRYARHARCRGLPDAPSPRRTAMGT